MRALYKALCLGAVFIVGIGGVRVGDATAENVKIGVIAPLSGVRADAGEYITQAITLAKEDLEANQSLQHRVSFVMEDSQYIPSVAVTAFQKLRSFDGVNFVIGPQNSSEVLAVGPLAGRAGVILITAGAQNDEISELGENIFRLVHNMSQEAPLFARFVAGKMKGETLHCAGTSVMQAYLRSFIPAFEGWGKKIGVNDEFDVQTTDFRSFLMKVKAKEANDILIVFTPVQAGLFLKQARELGVKSQIYSIGVQGPETVKIAGKAAEGFLYPYSYDAQAENKKVRAFTQRYLQRFGAEPDALAVNAYDAAMLLSSCFEKVGTNVDAVRRCLYQTKDYDGVGGVFSLDAKGDAQREIIIKTIKDGRFVRYQDLVSVQKND